MCHAPTIIALIVIQSKLKIMKVAITATGNNQQALLDQRFGHCRFFVIYDTVNQAIEFLPNTFSSQMENAGKQAVQFLASREVQKIVSGEFGARIKPLMDSLKIQMIILKNKEIKIGEIIDMLNHK